MSNLSIKPDRDYLLKIIDKIENGEFAIPRFQRDYIWTQKQRSEFFDSIIKGYPVGNLIVWQPSSDTFKSIEIVGGLAVDLPESDKKVPFYVLDGRQRITTLVALLHSQGELANTIYIDLDDFAVISKNSNYTLKFNEIGITDAFDPYKVVEYIDRLRTYKIDEEREKSLIKNVKRLNSILLSYELGYTMVKGGDISDATEIFSRLNSHGTDISTVDMMQALEFPSNREFLFREEIKGFQNRIEDKGFGKIKEDIILKAMAVHDGKPFQGFRPENLCKEGKLEPIWLKTEESILKAVDFLQKECYVREFKWLPYNIQFLLINTFFAKVAAPSSSQSKELRYWFFYTTFSRDYNNISMPSSNSAIEKMDAFISGESEVLIDYSTNADIPSDLFRPLPDVKTGLPANPLTKSVDSSILNMTVCEKLESIGKDMSRPIVWRLKLQREMRDSVAGWFLCESEEATVMLKDIFEGKLAWSEEMLAYGLTKEGLEAWLSGAFDDYIAKRKEYLLEMIDQFRLKMLR